MFDFWMLSKLLCWFDVKVKLGQRFDTCWHMCNGLSQGVVASVLCTQRFWNLLVTWALHMVHVLWAVKMPWRNAATPMNTDLIHACLHPMKVPSGAFGDEHESCADDRQKLQEVMHGILWKPGQLANRHFDERWLRLETPTASLLDQKRHSVGLRFAPCTDYREESMFQLSKTFARSRSKLLSNC